MLDFIVDFQGHTFFLLHLGETDSGSFGGTVPPLLRFAQDSLKKENLTLMTATGVHAIERKF